MKRLVALILAVAVAGGSASASQAHKGRGHGGKHAGLELTYKKWTAPFPNMVGVVGGDIVGTFGGAVYTATPDASGRVQISAIYIVNFDETRTTEATVTTAILNAGAGVVQFNNFSMVAALATPAQLLTIAALPACFQDDELDEPARVEQRAAGVARIDRSIRLDKVFIILDP